MPASLLAFLFTLVCAARALADVTSVSITSPTAGGPASVNAGASFPVVISYTANDSGSANVDVVLTLMSGSTVVGSATASITKQFPGPTTANLTFAVTNCTPNGTFMLGVDATDGVGVSASQASAVVIGGGKPASFDVTGGGSYCSGGQGMPIGLSGSEFGVNYQLKKGSSNSGSPVAGTGEPISFGNAIFPGTYTVVATSATSGCVATMNGSATIVIKPASYGGTATPSPGTICSGSSTTITLSGQVGTIVAWEYTTDDGETWTATGTTSNPLLTGPLTVTTYFRAAVSNGDCAPAYSGIVGVTVDPVSIGGTVTPTASAVCSGSSTMLTLSGQTGHIVRWEVSTDGNIWTTNVSTANPLNSGTLTATRYFRAVVQSGLCSQTTSLPAVVTVNPATVGGSAVATAGTICSGSGTTISLSGQTGSIVRWEASTDGSSWAPIASTANPLATGTLTATTLFRAMVQSEGCAMVDSSAATVTVNPTSVGGAAVATASTLCSGSSTTISLSGHTGSVVRWESSTDGNTWVPIGSTANPFNTGNLTATKQFRAVVQSGDCLTANSAAAIVTVNPPTVGGTAIAAAGVVCSGSATTISLSGQTGAIVRWEFSVDGANWSPIESTDNPLNTGTLMATTQFRAMVQSGSCTMLDSSAATVTVDPVSVGGTATATASTVCRGTSTTITLSGHTGSIVQWETSLDGNSWTQISSTANPLNTGNLTATKHFRAVVRSGVCATATSAEAVVSVNPVTVGGAAGAAQGTICSGSSTAITLSGQTGSIVRWESSTDGSAWSPIYVTDNPLVTGILTATTQFRAIVQSGDCSMVDSSAAMVTVNPVSVGGTATPAVGALCSGSATTISLSGHTGSIVGWETSSDGNSWSPIGSIANPLNTGILTATKRFRAVVQSGLCSAAYSSDAVVTVNPPPSITGQPASAVRLVGDSVSFSVAASYATSYQWRKNGSPINGATLSTYIINPLSVLDAAIYDCVVGGESPCATATSSTATLVIASKLVFSSEPVNTIAGAMMPAVVVQLQDQSGNDMAVSGVAISLSLNGGGTLSGAADAMTDSNGKATFSMLSIAKAGTGYTLTANSTDLAGATSSSFTISAAIASAYRIQAGATTLAPGMPQLLALTLVDQFGNPVTTFNGDKNLTFSGLSAARNGLTHPTVTDKTGAAVTLGAVTTITFTNGHSSAGGSLIAYKGEDEAALSATDGALATFSPGGAPIILTVPNLAPSAGTDAVARARNTQLRILISNLLTNDSDANRDLVSFVGVSSTSANGATVFADSTRIYYVPLPDSNPASDSFTYTISDSLLTAVGTVNVTLLPEPTGKTFNIVSSVVDGNGHPVVTFAGFPGYTYKIQRSANLSNWIDLWTTNVPPGGLFECTDPNESNPAFYRAINE